MSKKFYRNVTEGKIAGVCSGLADYFEKDVTLVRLAVIVLALVTGGLPFLVAYLVAWVIVPTDLPGGSN